MNHSFQNAVQEILDSAVASGQELGVQCVVMKDGVVRAACHAGYCDAQKTRPVDQEALFPVFSTGKALFSTLALKLLQDAPKSSPLRLDMPLSELWPEFATGLKAKVTLRHVLTHTSGMHILPPIETPEELLDWDGMCWRIAAREPIWEPGTHTGYQALAYTWLLGETLRRVTGKPVAQLLREELLVPADVTSDLFFGIPESEEPRIGEIAIGDDLSSFIPPQSKQTFLNPLENAMRLRAIRAACLPAFNCLANARGLARFGSALAQGRFLSEATLRLATSYQHPTGEPIPSEDFDQYWTHFGLGYILLAQPPERGALFGHHGYGGSELSIDRRNGAVYAIVKNRLSCKVNQAMKLAIHALPVD